MNFTRQQHQIPNTHEWARQLCRGEDALNAIVRWGGSFAAAKLSSACDWPTLSVWELVRGRSAVECSAFCYLLQRLSSLVASP